MDSAVEDYVSVHSKSQFIGFLLTLFFGPLGLFYSSWVAGLILSVVAIASFYTVIGPILCWFFAICDTFYSVNSYNQKIRAKANLMRSK